MLRVLLGPSETTPRVDPDGSLHTPVVLLVAGDGLVSTYELDRQLVIGRDPACDVVIDHHAVSRQHAVLRSGAPMTVQDLGSTNGTRIAGTLRRGGDPLPLAGPSDGFHIGPFAFVIVGRSSGDARTPAHDILRVVDPTPGGVPAIVGEIAATKTSVLILGETGVGKEVLAATLHALSGREGPLTSINCAALSETLLESELFGYEKGAFTGAVGSKMGLLESTSKGTVFLDEVGELPLSIQAKLLRAVEHREVLRVGAVRATPIDVRFIAATNRDLPGEVAAGTFRGDLYFRLDGITLVIPPLRERRGLIAPLALQFVKQRGVPRHLATEVIAALEQYRWPGNVRELKAVIERALLLAGSKEIGLRHLAFTRRARQPTETSQLPVVPQVERETPERAAPASDFLDFLGEAERADRARLVAALEECNGNQTRTAKLLGIGRTALIQKMRLYRIPRPRV